MYTLTLLSIFLAITNVSAFPKPLAFPQYGVQVTSTSLAAAPTPTPTPTPSPVVAPPVPVYQPAGSVFICSDANWTGSCTKKFVPLGSGPDTCGELDGTATSIGPDEGFTCYFYTNAFCHSVDSRGSDMLELRYPGSPNVGFTDKGNFNDRFLSFQCLKSAPPRECLRGIC